MLSKTQFNIEKKIFIPLGLLIFFLPSVSVTVKSGGTTVFLLILLSSIFFCWGGWKDLFPEEKLLLSGFVLFVLLVSCSFINSSDLGESFGSFGKYFRFVMFVPMYLFFRRHKIELGPWLSLGVVLGCMVLGLVALYQYYELGILRPNGVRNSARFGLVAVILFLLLVMLIINEWRNTKLLVVGMLSVVIIAYAITLNQTRAALISIVPFFGILLIYFRSIFKGKFAFYCCLALVAISLIFIHPSSPVAKRFNVALADVQALVQDPIKNYYSSTGLRLHMFHAGYLVFLKSPIIGTGLSDYEGDVEKLIKEEKTFVDDPWLLTSPHNIYINLLAEAGLLGFIGLMLAVVILPLYCYYKLSKRYKNHINAKDIRLYVYSGSICIMCYFLFGMFHTWININNSISIFLLFQLVYLSNSYNLIQRETNK